MNISNLVAIDLFDVLKDAMKGKKEIHISLKNEKSGFCDVGAFEGYGFSTECIVKAKAKIELEEIIELLITNPQFQINMSMSYPEPLSINFDRLYEHIHGGGVVWLKIWPYIHKESKKRKKYPKLKSVK